MRSSDYLVGIATTTVLLYTTVSEMKKKKHLLLLQVDCQKKKTDQYEVGWGNWGDTINAFKWISYRRKKEKTDRNSKDEQNFLNKLSLL